MQFFRIQVGFVFFDLCNVFLFRVFCCRLIELLLQCCQLSSGSFTAYFENVVNLMSRANQKSHVMIRSNNSKKNWIEVIFVFATDSAFCFLLHNHQKFHPCFVEHVENHIDNFRF